MEEPGGLQPLGSQRVRHNLATNFHPRSGPFNRRDRGQTQGTAIHWALACHGSIRDDAPEMQAGRSAEQQHRWTPGICWVPQAQVARSGQRSTYKPEMAKVRLDACWECVILSWKTLSRRETRSNLHFRKGTVAEVWKINQNKQRLKTERGGRDNKGMNLQGSASVVLLKLAFYPLNVSPSVHTHTHAHNFVTFISNQASS